MEQQRVVEILAALHRGHGSYIGFARKTRQGKFENLFSFQVDEVARRYSELVPWLVRDAYFTVNGMYRAAPYKSHVTQEPGVWRKEQHLRYLNACYVDLDVGRTQGTSEQCLSTDDAERHFFQMVGAGELPQASILARSGRGLYAFWLLHDEDDPSQPPRCWHDSLELYKSLQHHITRRLEHLAADLKAVDGARVLRVPGTRHGRIVAQAHYQFWLNAQGQYRTYSMHQLAAFLSATGVQVRLPEGRPLTYGVDWVEEIEGCNRGLANGDATGKPSVGEPAKVNSSGTSNVYGRPIARPGHVPARVNGAQMRAALRAQDIVSLEQWRGGWTKGRRRFHLSLYAALLRAAGVEYPQVLEAVQVMAANCQPAYPSDPNDTPLHLIVDGVFRSPLRPYATASLCKWLGITPDIARELELRTIIPAQVAAERALPPGGQRELNREARRDFMRAHIKEHGCSSARLMVEALKDAGFEASRRTVNDDLNALGYSTAPARRGGRPSQAKCGLAARPRLDLAPDERPIE